MITTVGDDPDAIAAAAWAMTEVRQVQRRADANATPRPGPGGYAAAIMAHSSADTCLLTVAAPVC